MPLPDLTTLNLADCPLLEKYGGGEASPLLERLNKALAAIRQIEGDRKILERLPEHPL